MLEFHENTNEELEQRFCSTKSTPTSIFPTANRRGKIEEARFLAVDPATKKLYQPSSGVNNLSILVRWRDFIIR